mmetsp:Transcript_39547/g.77273  ORF Transcript_39547/g.77273 Transcript_39547/m.77273 type:complete len:510 (-) Transcript_39547:2-1531(-)
MEGSLRDFGQGAEGRPRGQRSFASPCGRTGATKKLHSCGGRRQRGSSRGQRRGILAAPPRFLGAVIGAVLAGEFFRAAGGLVKGIVGVLHAHRLGVVPVLRSGHSNAHDPRRVGALQVSQPRRGPLRLLSARFASDPPLLLAPAAPSHAPVLPPLRPSVAQHLLLPFPPPPAVHQYELVRGQTHPPELDVKPQQLSDRAQQQQPEAEIHGVGHHQKGPHGLGTPVHAPLPAAAASVRLRVHDRDTLARGEPRQKKRHGRHRPPEVPVVRRSDTRIEPLAMVVEAADALFTVFAVHRARVDGRLAQPAVFRERTPLRPPLVHVGAAGRRQGVVQRVRDTAERAPEDRQEGVHARKRPGEEGRRHDPDVGGVAGGHGEVGAQFRIDGIRRDGAVAQDPRGGDQRQEQQGGKYLEREGGQDWHGQQQEGGGEVGEEDVDGYLVAVPRALQAVCAADHSGRRMGAYYPYRRTCVTVRSVNFLYAYSGGGRGGSSVRKLRCFSAVVQLPISDEV